MDHNILIAGSGGQGVMILGFLIARTAMNLDMKASCMPSYGPEMRGGTANCTVIFSDDEIASPIVKKKKGMILLNGPSLEKFGRDVEEDGIIIVNSSLIADPKSIQAFKQAVGVPCNDIALTLGEIRAANMVALGAYLQKTNCLSLDAVIKGMEESFPGKKKIIDLNVRAIQLGMDAVK